MNHPECTACGLCETAITVGLGSRGQGKILFVGEAPGAQEDVAGVPFIGRAGHVLSAMIEAAGLLEKDITFSNAVRCRPPNNRKPTPKEVNACRPHLHEEIAALNPTAIVALGDTALRSLTGRSGVKNYRGQELALHKTFGVVVPVLCTYHPAYVLRVPTYFETVVADLRRLTPQSETEVRWRRDETVPKGDVIAFDIETDYDFETKTGGEHIIQIAYASEEGGHVARTIQDVASLSRPTTIVGHNSWAFDLPKLRKATGLDLPQGDDTMCLAYLDDETQPLGLEALCVKYLGVKGWKEGIHAIPGSDEFALYNARDAIYTLRLYRVLCDRLGDRKRIADYIIRPAYQALQACTARGIALDYGAVVHAQEVYESRRAYAAEFLRLYGIDNPKSNAQVARALGLEGHVLPLTETGLPATGISVLSGLAQTKLVRGIRSYRKAAKALDAFVTPYLALCLQGDGRAHAEYLLWRTLTGRSNAKRPNVQQLARDPLLRSFFSAAPGYEFVAADYAAIEFRLAAFVAGCTEIIRRYAENPLWDPHRWMAAIIYNKPESDVTDLERQIAKSANFGLLYMAQWFTLQAYVLKTTGIHLSEAESKTIHKKWHNTFPEFRQWYARTEEQLYRLGYVETLTGRRRHYGDPVLISSLPEAARQGFLREAVNAQVQSLGADVAFLGLVACHRERLPITGFFHDANSFEFANGVLETSLPRIRDAMIDYPAQALREHFGIDLTVPLVIEVKGKDKKWILS